MRKAEHLVASSFANAQGIMYITSGYVARAVKLPLKCMDRQYYDLSLVLAFQYVIPRALASALSVLAHRKNHWPSCWTGAGNGDMFDSPSLSLFAAAGTKHTSTSLSLSVIAGRAAMEGGASVGGAPLMETMAHERKSSIEIGSSMEQRPKRMYIDKRRDQRACR